MKFAYRQTLRTSINLSRAGENDLDVWIVITARLEQSQLRRTIQFQIVTRVEQRVEVTDLSREIENDVDTTNDVIGNVVIPNVAANDFDAIGDAVEVKRITALLRHQRIDDCHFNTEVNECVREIAADKPHATGDQHGTTVVL